MALLRLANRVAVAAVGVAARRMRAGPRRHGWTYMQELLGRVLRETIQDASRLSIPEQRRQLDELPGPGVPGTMSTIDVDAGGVPATWLVPHKLRGRERELPVVLYFHGGGYVIGSLATHGAMVSRLAHAAGCNVLFPHYRLAPEHPFPAAPHDGIAALEWLLKRGYPPEKIVVAGDSAGGGLALATLLQQRERKGAMPAGLWLLSPWVDLTLAGETHSTNQAWDYLGTDKQWRDAYAGSAAPDDPLVSPLHASLEGLPPTLLHYGAAEQLAWEDRALADKLRAAGVPVTAVEEDLFHDWAMYAELLPEGRRTLAQGAVFVLARTGPAAAKLTAQAA